jgi:hypothetical protein
MSLCSRVSDVSVALLLSASESAAAPAPPTWLKLSSSDVSVALLLSASESAAAPLGGARLAHLIVVQAAAMPGERASESQLTYRATSASYFS